MMDVEVYQLYNIYFLYLFPLLDLINSSLWPYNDKLIWKPS